MADPNISGSLGRSKRAKVKVKFDKMPSRSANRYKQRPKLQAGGGFKTVLPAQDPTKQGGGWEYIPPKPVTMKQGGGWKAIPPKPLPGQTGQYQQRAGGTVQPGNRANRMKTVPPGAREQPTKQGGGLPVPRPAPGTDTASALHRKVKPSKAKYPGYRG